MITPSGYLHHVARASSRRSADPAPSLTTEAGDELLRFQIRAFLRFAEARRKQGRLAEAAEAYRRVLALHPSNRTALFGLGEIAAEPAPPPREPEPPATRVEVAVTVAHAPSGRHALPAHVEIRIPRPPPAPRPAGPTAAAYFARLLAWRAAPAAAPAARPEPVPSEPVAAARPEPVPSEPAPAARPEPVPSEPALAPALAALLVGVLEYRAPGVRGRAGRTRALALQLGRELGVAEPDLQRLDLAASLSAVGGALDLLADVAIPEGVAAALRHRADPWDGAAQPGAAQPGPAQPAGEAIPLLARILAVACAFTRRADAGAAVARAVAEIEAEAGRRFDPGVVAAARRVLAGGDLRALGLGRGGRILLVSGERERSAGAVLAARLAVAGYAVEAVEATPADVLDRVRAGDAEAVLLSASCPWREAELLLTALRAEPAAREVPVLALDAPTPARAASLLAAGADACVRAEAGLRELREALSVLLGREARRRQEAPLEDRGTAGDARDAHALSGDLGEFALPWLLQMLGYGARTAAVSVRGAAGEGVVYVERGEPSDARISGAAGGERGEAALAKMLAWRSGRFVVRLGREAPERTIRRPLLALLLGGAPGGPYMRR